MSGRFAVQAINAASAAPGLVYIGASVRFLVMFAFLAALGGCDPIGDLPPLRASSSHFRYFARAEASVQADIIERLEQFRADVYKYLNLSDDAEVNYYLFDDLDDLSRNSPCGRPQDCTVGRDVYSVSPLLEHELIHAFLANAGSPASPIAEGIAESLGCNRTNLSPQVEKDWRRCVSEYPTNDVTIYASDQRFVKDRLLQSDPDTFLRYYRRSSANRDPDLFAQQFLASWSQSIDTVWPVALATGVLDDGVSPICPCAVGALSPGMDDVVIAHANAADYRPIAVGPDSSALFRFTQNSGVRLQDCNRETPTLPLLDPEATMAGLVLIQGVPSPYFLSFPSPGMELVSVDANPSLTNDCSSSASLTVTNDVGQLVVVIPPLTGTARRYVKLSLTNARTARRKDAAIAGVQDDLRVCTDCTLGDCRAVSSLPDPVPVSDGDVLEFSALPFLPTSKLETVTIEFL